MTAEEADFTPDLSIEIPGLTGELAEAIRSALGSLPSEIAEPLEATANRLQCVMDKVASGRPEVLTLVAARLEKLSTEIADLPPGTTAADLLQELGSPAIPQEANSWNVDARQVEGLVDDVAQAISDHRRCCPMRPGGRAERIASALGILLAGLDISTR